MNDPEHKQCVSIEVNINQDYCESTKIAVNSKEWDNKLEFFYLTSQANKKHKL